ncbi:MAG: PDZ domain-containing protein [Planctomycetes bacterium]|nr:PDZ domain-containing protein [Planctomycetota bacterium]NOG55009.1 PDZ domain-containing protein [Planctomycetota bacterium]
MAMLANVGSFILFVIGFGLVIFVHELGHFAVAKWVGIKVEQFAIGIGTAAFSWRKGIGWRFGSTYPEYQKRLDDGAPESSMGETEYRINWLPLGGYVKMLGQDDLDMSATATDSRSYSAKPISSRMAVISAGVIMNVLFAIVLFMVCFQWGVKFESAVIGLVPAGTPAALAEPLTNTGTVDETLPLGLQPGDRIVSIDGKTIDSFPKIRMAAAIAKPNTPMLVEVKRNGATRTYRMLPKPDSVTGLLDLGFLPTNSTKLFTPASAAEQNHFDLALLLAGIEDSGVQPGMVLTNVDDAPISSLWQLSAAIDSSDGNLMRLTFADTEADTTIDLEVLPDPDMMTDYVGGVPLQHFLGLCPVLEVGYVKADSVAAKAGLETGDLVVRLGEISWPRPDDVTALLKQHAERDIQLVVGRQQNADDGTTAARHTVTLSVNAAGSMGIPLQYHSDSALLAASLTADEIARATSGPSGDTNEGAGDDGNSEPRRPAFSSAALEVLPGSQIVEVNGSPVTSWRDFHVAVLDAMAQHAGDTPRIDITLGIKLPIVSHPVEQEHWNITSEEIASAQVLGWHSDISVTLFEQLWYDRKAENPLQAVQLGFHETVDTLLLTYLTLDRLVRGSVKVSHLKGPVGIAELGTRAAKRGMAYLLMVLGIISVNLAVLNFLPIPILDGGLFLFLIIEKIKGSPVSERVQIAATYVGLFIIGSLFVVTFYNDVTGLIRQVMS